MKNLKLEDISHWNIWFTDRLLGCMTNCPNESVISLFKPYATFSRMSEFFGLSKTYLQDKRRSRWAKEAIALSLLEKMIDSVKYKINQWKILYPYLVKEFIKIEEDLINLIRRYQNKFNPKQKPFSWLNNHHPNLDLNYFANIKTLQQAYWLGYLIADRWITLMRKPHGDYYKVGFSQAQKDNESVLKFVRALGLNRKYVKNILTECNLVQSRKKSVSTIITFYSGNVNDKNSIANDLIKLGMKYEYDAKKEKRKKIPRLIDLGNHHLMLAYLLGLYDGDGTIAYNKKNGGISPSIASSNKLFLEQIKQHYHINSRLQKSITVNYDYKRNKYIKGECYKLTLGHGLFKQMMSLEIDSMKRKRITSDLLKKPILTGQRKWLAEHFTDIEFDSLLDVISPTKISKLLGIHRETIVSFAKRIYHLEVPSGSYYNQLATYLQHNGKKVPFYSELVYWINYLENIGVYSKN